MAVGDLVGFPVVVVDLAEAVAVVPGRCNLSVPRCVLKETIYPMKPLFIFFLLFFTLNVFAQDKDFHLDKEYAISQNGIIDLSSSDAEVIITGTPRNATARVKIDRVVTMKGWCTSRGDFKINIDAENGNLKIKEYNNSTNIVMIGYVNENYKIQIEAPEGITLKVHGDDGNYFIKNINGAISMSIDDGDVQLVSCGGNAFQFRLDDGDLKMDKGMGSLNIVADDADIEISDAAFSSIETRLDDGDFIVHTSLANNGTYSIDLQDGMILLDVLKGGGEFNIRHDDAHVHTKGAFNKTEDSENFTRYTLANGTAKIAIHADDAAVNLNTK